VEQRALAPGDAVRLVRDFQGMQAGGVGVVASRRLPEGDVYLVVFGGPAREIPRENLERIAQSGSD
jgi:hypothetical protein